MNKGFLMDLIIKNGTIVTAIDTYQADIGVADGTIAQIGRDLGHAGARIVDATGRYVFPGGVDTHVHLDTPVMGTVTADDYASGTIAAACGGTTSIVDFCFQAPGQSLADALSGWHAKAEGQAAVDYGFHIVVADPTEAVLRELAELPGQGITSFKLFMAYKDALMADDWTLLRVLEVARQHGALVMVHAENGDAAHLLQQRFLAAGHTSPKYHLLSRPPRIEAEAVARAIALAEIVGAPIFIVHMSCGEALDELARGRARGAQVFAETCPHYLYISDADFDRPGFEPAKYCYSPPPRPQANQALLWRALANGTLQSVGSDHAPFNFAGQKELGRDDFTKIPSGAPGIEERLMMIYQGVGAGRLTLNRFVELVATAPARLFGLYPEKGTIAIGSDADLLIWNPDAELTLAPAALHQHVDYTVYEGRRVRGLPETVILRGQVIVEGREFVGQIGGGRFLRRKRFRSSQF
jgi:dihydropyrimidinase